MEKSEVQANLQLMDSYISQFSLNAFDKITSDKELEINANVGFGIVDIKEKEKIGQVELKYDIDITNKEKVVTKIIIVMKALFKGDDKTDKAIFEQMLKVNGATTLSHLCRAYINATTSLSGMPTITMPLINFYEFFENAKMADKKMLQKENDVV